LTHFLSDEDVSGVQEFEGHLKIDDYAYGYDKLMCSSLVIPGITTFEAPNLVHLRVTDLKKSFDFSIFPCLETLIIEHLKGDIFVPETVIKFGFQTPANGVVGKIKHVSSITDFVILNVLTDNGKDDHNKMIEAIQKSFPKIERVWTENSLGDALGEDLIWGCDSLANLS
jgi:hypothetical protein